MSVHLPDRPSLSSLRKQAKSLLKSFRARDAEALEFVQAHHPAPDEVSALRDVQLAIARAYGYGGWLDLCRFVEEAIDNASTIEEQADLFANLACLSYFGNDHVSRRERAEQMLAESPRIAYANVYAAAAAFDVDALTEHLSADGHWATAAGGPRDWPPLLYVCYSRVTERLPARDAVAAAQRLLVAGAPGNVFTAEEELGGWRWAGLTGAMGEGEQGLLQQPPHARARELAELLLDAGADPNDAQGLYNTMFSPGNEWLELLLAHGLDATAPVDPDRDDTKTLDYQLSQAVKRGLEERVALLLEHGADATALDTYNHRSNYENAMLGGYPAIAAALVEHGARAIELSAEDQFSAAAMRGDRATASALLRNDPHLLAPNLLREAAQNPVATKLLLELGGDPNAPSSKGGRVALHEAAWFNNIQVIDLLLAAGASCDIRESGHQATPIGFANHAGHFDTRDRLLDHSRDVPELASYGRVDQVRQVLAEDPSRAAAYALLHRLPGLCGEEVVRLLLEHGADINGQDDEGATPLDRAAERDDVAMVEILKTLGAEGRKSS